MARKKMPVEQPMTHRHRFKVEVRRVCSCGTEGEACEACGAIRDLADMRSDSEGVHFCQGCHDDLTKAARSLSKKGAPARPSRKAGGEP